MNVLVVDTDWYAENQGLLPNHAAFDTSKMGNHIPMGDFSLIVLNKLSKDTKKNRGLRMYVLAHELGHAIEGKVFAGLNDFQRKYLNKAYKQYQDDGGRLTKDEWMADKVGTYLLDNSSKSRNFVELTFKNIAKKLREYYRAAAQYLKKAFGERFTPDTTVNEVMDALIRDKVLAGKWEPGTGKPKAMDAEARRPMMAPMFKLRALSAAMQKGKEFGSLMYRIGTFLYTGDRQLRDLGPAGEKIARMFHLNPGEGFTFNNVMRGVTLKTSFFQRVMSERGRYWTEYMNMDAGGKKIGDYYAKPAGLKGKLSPFHQVKKEY
ncbi:hypothetical protein, partial [Kistimonas scapharcae]|uniref:hypothetical protein n=1 Tax=Kistimonas scapharcae TaxID=1036133 RepID=UPI0031E6E99C